MDFLRPPGDDLLKFLVDLRLRGRTPSLLAAPPELPPSSPRDIKSPLTKKWNPALYSQLQAKLRQVALLSRRRIKEITAGLTMPEIANVPIGGAKRMTAATVFFDLKDFTARTSHMSNEDTLYTLNAVIPTVMTIIRHWNGEIEKNTGDGVMAIFGTETRNDFLIARDTIEAAMAIRYVMRELVNPHLGQRSILPFKFRIGADMEEVLIARIGIANNSFLTVVSSAANRASKLQEFAYDDGICIGNNLFTNPAIK